MWKLPDGRVIRHPSNKTFQTGEGADSVNHPERNLLYWNNKDLKKYGIYKYVELGYDQKYFNSTGKTETINNRTIVVAHTTANRFTDKELKRMKIKDARKMFSGLIAPYQWFYDRAADPDTTAPVPQEIRDYKIAARAALKIIETEIKALTTYEQIIDYNISDKWPVDPPDCEEPVNGELE